MRSSPQHCRIWICARMDVEMGKVGRKSTAKLQLGGKKGKRGQWRLPLTVGGVSAIGRASSTQRNDPCRSSPPPPPVPLAQSAA